MTQKLSNKTTQYLLKRHTFQQNEQKEANQTPPAESNHPKALDPVLALMQRQSWRPVTTAREGALCASKFGGRPYLAPPSCDSDTSWPLCPNCETPLQLFLQLNIATLPDPMSQALGEQGLIQLFYCTNSEPLCEVDREGWRPFSAASLVRQMDLVDADFKHQESGPQPRFEERIIVDWKPLRDYPSNEELWESGEEIDDQQEAFLEEANLAGDKLGGWPHWVQGVEYVECPKCNTLMNYVFQVDSNDQLPFMFGDSGIGHLSRCPHHPEIWAFGWASY